MGRRKIEIKAIKDDRNRSVTFLKRKGGLFKKAHELAVLCSVDVAVIIFGHNKKLYEFSSGNINDTLNRYSYVCQTYGGPHEHKGPEDFAGKGKGGDSDEDDEDAGSPRPESHSPPQPSSLMQHHLQNAPAFQHPSASPPMQNGAFHRGPSPVPQNISRPGSRTHFRQQSANLIPPPPPHHMPQYSSPQPPQGGFTHMTHPPMYQSQAIPGAMQVRPPSNPPHPSQFTAYGQPPSTVPPQMQSHYIPPQQIPPQIQIQQPHPQPHPHTQDQRRQSMPQQLERLAVQIPEQAAPAPPPLSHSPPPPQPQDFHSPPQPQPRPLPLPSAATHSIFTPIEASSSFLAQHFGKPSTSNRSDVKEERSPPDDKPAPVSRSLSIDTAMGERKEPNGIGLRPPIKVQPPQAPTSNPVLPVPQRTSSTPTLNGPPQPPSRTNSLGPARPRLKVQIPAEQSDEEGTSKKTTSSSPRTTVAATLTPIRENNIVHLPPPSPSASALLSAGATGPPNPFARPAPPTSTANGFRGELDTPMSALPSRFMSDQFLPSPSGFYSDFSFSRDNNMLPSPLAFPTPMNPNGPSFKDEDIDKKRKMSESHEGNPDKKVKV